MGKNKKKYTFREKQKMNQERIKNKKIKRNVKNRKSRRE